MIAATLARSIYFLGLAALLCSSTVATPTSDLFHAIKRRNVKEAREAIRQRARPDHIDDDGKMPLHYAAASSHSGMVDFLLDFGHVLSRINTLDHENKTALWYAAQAGNDKVIDLLLKKGADSTIPQNEFGWRPAHVAAKFGRCAALKRLSKEHSIDIRDNDNWTPLHVAAYYGEESGIKCALDLGANPRLTVNNSKRKKTAQKIAYGQGFHHIAQTLKLAEQANK